MTDEAIKRLTGFLGLCARAGQLTLGQDMCVGLIRSGRAALALTDAGASGNTLKRLSDGCASHQTPLYLLPEGLLASAVGKDGRRVAAMPKGGMANRIIELLSGETPYQHTND